MRRVLVTGGAGFLGGHVVAALAARQVEVTVVDRLTPASSPQALAGLTGVRLVVADVADADGLCRLARGHDAVVHLAAESHVDRSLADPLGVVRTNLLGTASVLEAARAHDLRLHHVSTDEVWGDLPPGAPPVGTAEPGAATAYRPSSPYAASKAGADHLVRAWAHSYGVRATISASTNCYGPWQHVEKLLPRTITTVLAGGRPRLFGDGRQVRSWLHAADHAAGVLAALERGSPGETYLLGSREEVDNRTVAGWVLGAAGRDPAEVDLVADRAGHDRRYALDPHASETELGWRATRRLDEAIPELVAWYAEHRDWWEPRRAAVEAEYLARGQ